MTIRIESGDWDSLRGDAAVIRYGVFVLEQNVPEDMELDLLDPVSRHWLARSPAGNAVATARLTPDHQLGRMAVLREWRGRGIGTRLVETIQQHALERQVAALILHAQLQAIPFYRRLGFLAEGPTFDDAGIPHRRMRWTADRN